jgi:hypothetical protein
MIIIPGGMTTRIGAPTPVGKVRPMLTVVPESAAGYDRTGGIG